MASKIITSDGALETNRTFLELGDIGGGGGGSGLTVQTALTSNTTLLANFVYPSNASGLAQALVHSLPASPANNDKITIVNSGGNFCCHILPNGKNINGLNVARSLIGVGDSATFQFHSTTDQWYTVEGDSVEIPISIDGNTLKGCWLPDAGITLVGNEVQSWSSIYGSHILTAPNAVNRPSYISSSVNFNGKPTLYFNGTSNLLQTSTPILTRSAFIASANYWTDYPQITAERHLFGQYRTPTVYGSGQMFFGIWTRAGSYIGINAYDDANGTYLGWLRAFSFADQGATSTYIVKFDGNTQTGLDEISGLQQSMTPYNNVSSIPSGQTSTEPFRIGGHLYSDGSYQFFWLGGIQHVIAYNGNSSGRLESILQKLARLYR